MQGAGCRSRAGLRIAAALGVGAIGCGGAAPALAYTAAGDRLFPATLVLPQIAPNDEVYLNDSTLPLTPAGPGSGKRYNTIDGVFTKTITDRLGIKFEQPYTKLDRVGMRPAYGFQNFEVELKYMAINDIDREFLLSFGLDREFATGAVRVGAAPQGQTSPRIYFGKGLGDLDIGYLRPLAVAGFGGYQISDQKPRPNVANAGMVVYYSIPYLQSKVQSLDLPDFMRNLTPMTEVVVNVPTGPTYGVRTTAMVAPGVSYAGEGWELGIEALVPLSKATGRGVGVTAQLHFSLDFLFPDTIGKPLFSAP
jgi:hypothetical protein